MVYLLLGGGLILMFYLDVFIFVFMFLYILSSCLIVVDVNSIVFMCVLKVNFDSL